MVKVWSDYVHFVVNSVLLELVIVVVLVLVLLVLLCWAVSVC